MTITDDSLNSYAWWRQHGHEWPAEVARRKSYQIMYTLQEAFFQTYLGSLAPARILEFGCGYGRHLKYLREFPGLSCYGCDQSAAMLDEMRRWAPEAWMAEHVQQVAPLGRLPYGDKAFDLVFTNSVLIHVAPAHISSILAELVRISRHEIIHIENNHVQETSLSSAEHDGCWMHPLIPLYAQIGATAALLPKGWAKQDIYTVSLEPWTRSTVVAEHLLAKLAEIESRWEEHDITSPPADRPPEQ